MIYSNNANFSIDYKKEKDVFGKEHYVRPEEGFTIYRKLADGYVPMVDVLPGADNIPFFTTYGTNVQDYIISWELFVDFVKAIDDANNKLEAAILSRFND